MRTIGWSTWEHACGDLQVSMVDASSSSRRAPACYAFQLDHWIRSKASSSL